jgi:hypothetical protein
VSICAIGLMLALLVGAGARPAIVRADGGGATTTTQSNLVNQANAPISSLFQIRLQDSYAPAFQGQLRGQGNFFSIAVGMPLPKYRLPPFPQLSLLTIPAAVTLPLPLGSSTAFGDIRFVDLGVLDAGHSLLFGVGPAFVFPTPSDVTTDQGKWQVGPAAAVAFVPRKWLLGILAQNPISFAGDSTRPGANALFLQPFITYQLGRGWFLRSEPQMVFDWETNKQLLPVAYADFLTIIFLSFGLFAPPNATVITTLFLCALSVSGAIVLILELDRPFGGLVQISSAPMRSAIAQIGK